MTVRSNQPEKGRAEQLAGHRARQEPVDGSVSATPAWTCMMKTWAVAAFSIVVVTTFLLRPNGDSGNPAHAGKDALPTLHKMADWSEHLAVEPEDEQATTVMPPADDSHALMDELMQAKDYRVIFESLLANPTEKSGLYAMHVLARCHSLSGLDFHATPSRSTQQEEARQRLDGLCRSFTPEEVSPRRWQQLVEDPRIQGRYRELQRSLQEDAADPVKRRQVVREMLESRDPLLISALGSIRTGLIVQPDPDTASTKPDSAAPHDSVAAKGNERTAHKAVIYGRTYRHPDIEEITNRAWRSATCKATGTSCGLGDYNVMALCATDNHCVDSREAALRYQTLRDYGREGVAIYDRLQPQLVSAIRNINLQALGL